MFKIQIIFSVKYFSFRLSHTTKMEDDGFVLVKSRKKAKTRPHSTTAKQMSLKLCANFSSASDFSTDKVCQIILNRL